MNLSPKLRGRIGLGTKVLVVVLTLALISDKSGELRSLDFTMGDLWANLGAIFGFWVSILAPGFYLCALWALGAFFSKSAEDEEFGAAMVKSLREVGQNLLIGAVAAILIHPTLTVWMDIGFRGVRITTDIAAITIGLIGIALYLLAETGKRLRFELEQFI
ncbi:hypothetical protein K1X12_05655 [Hyphomonas sp. WL0036]|uniref:hypothetical protein n=1 Tax=Hyphomonas sediminis TaxID=2866160 RepID=UPI001C7F6C8D|nr:hypothetical protein [Hyphomonas sediminis]MBY9066373.1 hypothetical protein [Hyphomonas sediminis]